MSSDANTRTADEQAQASQALAGLVECSIQALPFFRGTLAGDVLYTALFFGLHALTLPSLSGRRQARALS